MCLRIVPVVLWRHYKSVWNNLYIRWYDGLTYNADRVYYWHDDSEIVALEPLVSGDYDIEYADGTVDTVSRYATVYVQLYNYGERHAN